MTKQHHAICPVCIRIVSKDDRGQLENIVSKHNEQRHDGRVTAEIVTADGLDDWRKRVRDEYPEKYSDIAEHIVNTDPWDILGSGDGVRTQY